MNTTNLQQVLRDGSMKLIDIQQDLSIVVRSHSVYENLKMFKYDMINSPMSNRIVRECRGIILDMDNNWEVVAYPFDKFFNFGESSAANVDWGTAKVQEKLDGSLMIVYHYDGKWHVASSGTPDACGQVHSLPKKFSDLFWETWETLGYKLPTSDAENLTFMFELMTPYNRVVVPHLNSRITLIGVRDNSTLQELDVNLFANTGWEIVKQFPIHNMETLVESFENFDGIRQEGYVVVDADFRRVKVKHPGYVAIHHMKGNNNDIPSYKKMFNLVVTGESSEVLTYFPEWKPIYEEVEKAFFKACDEIVASYHSAVAKTENAFPAGVHITETQKQKEFAAHAVKSKCSDFLFKMRAGKLNDIRQYFGNIDENRALEILGFKDKV
jgi:T4 RnlA family RNA ligase